jgi:hypothetical protein
MGDIAALVGSFESEIIPVYKPGETEYDCSVANENLLFRFTRPAFVDQPGNSFRVRVIVREAKSRSIPITIKNGDRSYAGLSTTNEGIVRRILEP